MMLSYAKERLPDVGKKITEQEYIVEFTLKKNSMPTPKMFITLKVIDVGKKLYNV